MTDTSAFSLKVKPLASKAEYNLWSIRIKALLLQHTPSLWDKDQPVDSPQSAAILISSISDDLLEQVASTDLQASTIWSHFKDTFVTSDLSSKSTALTSLISFKYDGASMASNKTKLLSLNRALKAAFNQDEQISIDDLVTLFALVNLPPQFNALRTTLEETTSDSTPLKFENLFTSLIREESAQHTSSAHRSTHSNVSASTAQRKCKHQRNPKFCWTCTPSSKPDECKICKQNGCKKTLHSIGSEICQFQQYQASQASSKSQRSVRFTVDSGSTDTLVSDKQDLQHYSHINHPIKTANGEIMYATEAGSIPGSKLSLNQVLVCPEVTENLLSVSKLDDQGLDTLFSNGHVYVGKYGTLQDVLLTGSRRQSSYYIDFPTQSEALQAKSSSLKDMHLRLNHLNNRDTKRFLNESAADETKTPYVGSVNATPASEKRKPSLEGSEASKVATGR
jgi:hypothetical protein